ncbi:uncharacterized protein PFL1_03710 [Pseudozyma flocculosa PF-1]|uniref:Mitochondrial import inner membrane translocase subunit TIM21 n=2 Tax=Pseudozyma flocculosa TaxID=84751 RepID=A0A5C3F290_9BASI|nr:uncharacterized protein PFL1_03710 [Pseudozyma flocculosa PF-1]EPQ28909.1 hypothetical protein PFL1_03710 [Pseudozyma flocculosa PF-1]SPO38604.1 uncharacterized protein PSFLO_04082 [Pseudozyma flocculosa]
MIHAAATTTSARTIHLALAADLRLVLPRTRLPLARQLHSSRRIAQQSAPGPSRKPFARVVNTKSSKAAFEQRQILDGLRGGNSNPTSSGDSSSLSHAQEAPRFNATAEAALNAAAGGRGGAMPLGMAGLSVGAGSQGGLIDRWTGSGKRWKDLKGGQKVARATVQSSRTVLIFGGAALTFVLVYALSTELFAKNSPTVVFGDACKRVQTSPEIAQHLLPPYRFHTSSAFTTTASPSPLNPPARGRRSRSVASYSYVDQTTGQEKMLLRFFVEARDKDRDLTLWDTTRYHVIEAGKWAGRKVQEGGEWVGDQLGLFDDADEAATGSHHAAGLDPSATTAASKPASSEPSAIGSALSSAWNYSFGGLTGLARGGSDALGKLTSSRREPGTWSSGEVHAEMEKDDNGVLQYKHFFVDIPSSSATVRERVWIVRKKGEVER